MTESSGAEEKSGPPDLGRAWCFLQRGMLGKERALKALVFAWLTILQFSVETTPLRADPLDQWTLRPVPNNGLYGLSYAAGTFVAVGGYGTVLTSSDSTTWAFQFS